MAAAVFTPLMSAIAIRLGAVDDTREPPIPRSGGPAIVAGAVTALVMVGVILTPAGSTLLGTSESLGAVGLGAAIVLLLGIVDDVRPLTARIKFAVQVAAALVVYWLGVRVETVSFPGGAADLGRWLGPAVTVVWLVGITNAFNLLDGADGVATGSAFFAAAAIFLMSVSLGHPAIGLVAASLAGALLGFLPANFPPARAFLGDSGSLVTGFLLAGLAVEGSTKGPTLVVIAVPLVAFGVPVFDTIVTMFRRLVRGESLFRRDREHVHHHLERAGLNPRQVAGVLYAASALFALAAMMFINPGVRSYAVALVVIGAGVWIFARFLRLHELNELARMVKRGARQRRVITHNVQLRRGTERLATAKSIEDLQQALAVLLERSEFDEVLLMITPAGERRGQARKWRLENGEFRTDWPDRRPDEWEVVCPFDGLGWHGQLHLRRRLGRPSLLIDMNLMVELVHGALGEAAGHISAEAVLAE